MTARREGHQQGTLAEEFRNLCQNRDAAPDVFAFLNTTPTASPHAKAEVLLIDQEFQIEAGHLRPVEEYFSQCPDVAQNEALSLELVASEFRHRTHRGESISVETFLARFPQFQNHLPSLLVSVPRKEAPAESKVADSMDSVTGDTTVDVPLDSPPQEDWQQTLEISADTFLNQPNEEENGDKPNKPRSTVEWEPNEADMQNQLQQVDDTAHENTNETINIDPETLGDMLGQFGTMEITNPNHRSLKSHGQHRGDSPDTLFESGVAYDKDRQLDEFGEYELLGEIARGGMGVVFKARQRKLKRIVALKMILSGNLADAEDIRRFYAEAESAAALDHPNIVPVYEVGEYRGQHYFSMGYVEGQSLADKIADHPLSAREAAQMMKMVAEAVEYAHQHGVIHRDLKPANVLLDAESQPKITDFGLAKRTEADVELTHTGQIMGTPSYMSPEQITGNSSLVGPRADVFSMGGMLYCLLTGRPPFQSPTLLDLLKQVQHQEPVSPRRLTSNLPVDLETICLKCLAKEPARRYQSAQEFAEDLDRFLKGIPVLARPVGQMERAWRWCKRYPVVAGLIAAVIFSLISGATVSTYYAIAADHRATEAMEQFERAETNFERAERNFQKAQAAVDQFFIQVSENTLLNQPGMQPLQHQLLMQALEYYQAFLAERGDDPELQDELAVTHFRVGIITEIVESPEAAIPSFEKARDLQTELLKTHPQEPELLQGLGNTLTALGRVYYRKNGFGRAEKIFQQAVDIRQTLADNQTQDHEAQRELANAYMNLGLVERGRAESLTDPEKQADALEKARKFYDKSQQIRRDLLNQGDLSTEILQRVYRDFGKGATNLGTLHFQMRQVKPGLENYREAASHFEKALNIEPQDQRTTLSLATCLHALAKSETDLNQAWAFGQKALSLLEPLVLANPDVDDYQKELVLLRADLGIVAFDRKQPQQATSLLKQSRSSLDPVLKKFPHDLKLLLKAMTVDRLLLQLATAGEGDLMGGSMGDLMGKLPVQNTQQIADLVQQKVVMENLGGKLRGEFAIELFQLGQQLQRHGHLELALKFSQHGVSLTGRLVDEESPNLNHHQNHQFGLGQLAHQLALDRQHKKAHETHHRRLKALSEFTKRIPENPETELKRANLKFDEAKTYNALAYLSLIQKEPSRTQMELDNAKGLLDSLIAQFPAHQAFFQQELNRTQSLRKQLLNQPAIAEKPASKSPSGIPQKDRP